MALRVRTTGALPAMWVETDRDAGVSIFGTMEKAWADWMASPEYKAFFAVDDKGDPSGGDDT